MAYWGVFVSIGLASVTICVLTNYDAGNTAGWNLLSGVTSIVIAIIFCMALLKLFKRLKESTSTIGYRQNVVVTDAVSAVVLLIGLGSRLFASTPSSHTLVFAVGTGSIVAGTTWIAFLVFTTFLYEYLFRRWLELLVTENPVEAVVYSLNEVLQHFVEGSRSPTLETRPETVVDLEIAVAAVERGLFQRFKVHDHSFGGWLNAELTQISATLRTIQRQVTLPNALEVPSLRMLTSKCLICASDRRLG